MSTIQGIKVGKTNIVSSYTDVTKESDSQEFSVIAVQLECIESPGDLTYTGTEQKPTPIVKAIVNGELKVLVNEQDYELSYVNNINVGTATVTATGIGNYTGEVSNTWNITNASINVEVIDRSYIYNGTPQGEYSITSISYSGSNEVSIKYGKTEGSYDLDDYPQITNVSESGKVYFQITIPNHNIYTGSYNISVTPKVAELLWGISSWVYDGEIHSVLCQVSNLESGDTCTVMYDNNYISSIGSKTVTATELSNDNYMLPSNDTIYHTITVSPGLFTRISGTWTPVKSVWKKVSGTWVKQEFGTAFSTEEFYVKKTLTV